MCALATPRVLRAARRRRHGRLGRRVALRRSEPLRPPLQVVRRRHRRRPRAAQHAPRGAVAGPRAGRPRSPPGSPRSRPASAASGRPWWWASSRGLAFVPVWSNGYLSRNLDRAEDVPSYWQRRDRRDAARGRRDARARDPRERLRRVPLGRHHRTDHSGPDGSPVRGARNAAVGIGAVGEHAGRTGSPDPGRHPRARRARRVRAAHQRRHHRAPFRPRVRTLRHSAAAAALATARGAAARGPRAAAGVRPPHPEPAGGVGAGRRRTPAAHPRRCRPTRPRWPSSTSATRSPSCTPPRPTDRSCSPATARASSTPPPPGSSTVGRWSSKSGSLTPAQLRQQLRADADLVLTDSNRRRNQQFFVGRPRQQRLHRAGRTELVERRVPPRSLPAIRRRRSHHRRTTGRHRRRQRVRHAERPPGHGGRRQPAHRVARRRRRRRPAPDHPRRPRPDHRPRHHRAARRRSRSTVRSIR